MPVICDFTSIGDRDDNLDRILHIDCGFFSISFIMDGFCIKRDNYHYVDYFVGEVSKGVKEISDLDSACDFILGLINSNGGVDGKSTLSVVIYNKDKIKYLSIGDSRIYFLNSKVRTKDDSIAQKLIDSGVSPESSLRTHPYRNRLCCFVSKNSEHQEVSFSSLDARDGEVVILCSDGFWCQCAEDDIWGMNTQEKVKSTFLAITNGAAKPLDNVSVALLEI